MKKSTKKNTVSKIVTLAQFERRTGIKFNKNMTGKMQDIICLSSSNLCNPFCAARKGNPDMICSKCFANGTCSRYKALRENMERNTEILTGTLFEVDEWPVLNVQIFRLESFGDLINCTQARNYLRFCKANPGVRFALWTKNPGILAQAVAIEGKPSNLVVLLSSALLDKRCDASRWSFVDKTFTVYRPETVDALGIDINCGARNCLTCQRCYRLDTESDVRELLK